MWRSITRCPVACDQMLAQLKSAARVMKKEVWALLYAMEHPNTPLLAKIVALITISYALSPIDLIPDFIPVLGVLDDLVLVPLGLWLAVKLIPSNVLEECHQRVQDDEAEFEETKIQGQGNQHKRKQKKTKQQNKTTPFSFSFLFLFLFLFFFLLCCVVVVVLCCCLF